MPVADDQLLRLKGFPQGINNVDSGSASEAQWLRTLNTATVSGRVSVNATTTDLETIFSLSLPVASNFTSGFHCAGIVTDAGNNYVGHIRGGGDDTAEFRIKAADATQAVEHYYHYTYRILPVVDP